MSMEIRADWHFTIIPEWVLDSTISPQAVRLYGVLRRYADKAGECIPGRRTLADRMHVSPSTVDRAVDELTLLGAVEVVERYDDRGDQTSNLYRLFSVPPYARVDRGVVTGDDPPLSTDDHTPLLTGAQTPYAPVTNKRKPVEREPFELETPPTPRDAGGVVGEWSCSRHQRKRRSCPDCQAGPPAPPPPWCGDCGGPAQRFVEVDDGARVAPCPRCHPSTVGVAS